MKPVVVCRYAPHEVPGYFATYLSSRAIPWRIVAMDEGEPLPLAGTISGLAMMGGPMSVNDELPWISPMLGLIRESIAADVPVIGHCLGGQLLAKALGASVTRSAVKEIGWGDVNVLENEASSSWIPDRSFVSFHWHGEMFSIPPGAVRIWSSTHCANQGFVLGKHLGMQCHIEMTEDMIDAWCETGADEIEQSVGVSPAVQRPSEMRENVAARLAALHHVADRVYGRWVEGLQK